MGEVSTIGVDIAKSVFQIYGVDTDGTVVIRKRVGRAIVLEFFAKLPPCLIGMEACGTRTSGRASSRSVGKRTAAPRTPSVQHRALARAATSEPQASKSATSGGKSFA